MKIVVSKIIWSVVALVCVLTLVYVWFIGFPVPDYVALDDGEPAKVYTIRTGPNTFFDVYMSDKEVLMQSDMETYYNFAQGSIIKSSTSVKADLIDADKQVYGRPGSFCYRVLNDSCTITVDSKLSTYQGLQSLLHNEEYTVYGDLSNLEQHSGIPLTFPELASYRKVTDQVVASRDFDDYTWNEAENSFIWYGEGRASFYKANLVYGLYGDVTQQLFATVQTCYKLSPTDCWVGDDYIISIDKNYVFGVRRINRNTHLVVVTNNSQQVEAAVATLSGRL